MQHIHLHFRLLRLSGKIERCDCSIGAAGDAEPFAAIAVVSVIVEEATFSLDDVVCDFELGLVRAHERVQAAPVLRIVCCRQKKAKETCMVLLGLIYWEEKRTVPSLAMTFELWE